MYNNEELAMLYLLLQHDIAADEKDYNTAYSYFYETFEGYRSMNEITLAGNAFKFMLFSKVMSKQPDDTLNLINSTISLKF